MHEKVRAWHRAVAALHQAQTRLVEAQNNLKSAQNTLGGHLCPGDESKDEVFNIWYGSGLLRIIAILPGRDYGVSWRKEPSVKQLGEMS